MVNGKWWAHGICNELWERYKKSFCWKRQNTIRTLLNFVYAYLIALPNILIYITRSGFFFRFRYMKQSQRRWADITMAMLFMHIFISHSIHLGNEGNGQTESEHISRSIDVHTFLSLSLAFGLSCSDSFFFLSLFKFYSQLKIWWSHALELDGVFLCLCDRDRVRFDLKSYTPKKKQKKTWSQDT